MSSINDYRSCQITNWFRFLLVVFQIRRVCDQTNAQEMLDTARSMPSDPDSIYFQTLKQIDSQAPAQARLARKVIAWLVLVKRNVTVKELAEAIAIEIGSKSLNPRLLSSETTLLRVCRGLVVMNREPYAGKSGVNQIVRNRKPVTGQINTHPVLVMSDDENIYPVNMIGLAHKTFQDFYLKNAADELSLMRTHICLACITYLGFDNFNKIQLHVEHVVEQRLRGHRFLAYATLFLEEHVEESGEPPEVIGALFDLFSIPLLAYNFQTCYLGQRFAGTRRVNEVLNPTKHFRMRIASGDFTMAPTVLHIGVLIGSSKLVCFILEKLKTELSHEADMDLSCNHSSRVEAKDYNERTALHWCALLEKPVIARMLLEHGANADIKDRLKSTILNDALVNKSVETMKILLETGFSVDSQKILTHSVWSYGDRYQTLEILEILITSGLNINVKARNGSTALHEAARLGFYESIDFLLANGADISKDGRGWTPLHCAAASVIASDINMIIQILIENGINIDAKAENGMTALHVAALNCNSNAAKALIDHGAFIDTQDEQGRTAIRMTIAMGIPHDHLAASYMVALLRGFGAISPGIIEDSDKDERAVFHSGVLCDHCEASVRTSDSFFNCSICDNGDFDLCQSCVKIGHWCNDGEHTLEETHVQLEDSGSRLVECGNCRFEFESGNRFFYGSLGGIHFNLCESCEEQRLHYNDIDGPLEKRFLLTIDPFIPECVQCGSEFGLSDCFYHCNICNLDLCQPCGEKRNYCSCFKNGLERTFLKITGIKRGSYPIPGYEMGFSFKYGVCYTEQSSMSNTVTAQRQGGQTIIGDHGKRPWSEQEAVFPHRSKHPRREQDSTSEFNCSRMQ